MPKHVRDSFDVCIVGLGYVGLTLATAFAKSGLHVVGAEKNSVVHAQLSLGKPHFHENGLTEAYSEVFSDKTLEILQGEHLPAADAYVVTVGTPVRNKQVWLADLESALIQVSNSMPEGALIVLRSTVLVGTTSGLANGILSNSGKKYLLAMAPERTLEGKALEELSSLPQIVGGINEESTNSCAELFGRLGVEIIRVSSPETAELSKLASNTYRDIQFAFANEIAYASDKLGVDVQEVIRACNENYPRMKMAKPGPVAGPCLEKDAYILQESLSGHGFSMDLTMAGRTTNENLSTHISDLVVKYLDNPSKSNFGILGVAFKGSPETSDTRGSMALPIAQKLREKFGKSLIYGWDPLVSESDLTSLGFSTCSLPEIISNVNLLILQTNHSYFSQNSFINDLNVMANSDLIVIDLWTQFSQEQVKNCRFKYVGLGSGGVLSGRK
jgi:UDP-N-acetyl-D-mannosaminuronic acid dehydrogenase